MPILLSQNIPTTIFCATLTTVLLSGKPVIIPTATLLEHALLAQGFMGISKVAFPRRLQLPNRDSTGAKLSNAIKCRCRVNVAKALLGFFPKGGPMRIYIEISKGAADKLVELARIERRSPR